MKTNLEIIQQAYNDFKQGNIPALLDKLSDDVSWELPQSAGTTFSGIFKGKNGVLEFFQQVAATNEMEEFAIDDFIASDDKVIALGHLQATSKTTGKRSANKWAHFWHLKNGKVIKHYEYVDTAEIKDAFTN